MSDLRDGSDRNVLYWKALRDTLGRMRQAEGEAPASPGAGALPPDDGGREEGLKELRSLRVRLEEALEEQTSLMERLDSMPSDGVLLDGLVQATHYMLERQTEANEGLGKYLGELESLRGSAAPQAPAGAADGAGTRQEGEPRASGAAEESTAGGIRRGSGTRIRTAGTVRLFMARSRRGHRGGPLRHGSRQTS